MTADATAPHLLRLRQICLAVPLLDRVVDDLQAIFGLSVCHRDPGLAAYGLENALLPVGTDFLEVVSPIQADTAAGRFIERTRGHGGYMAIFQAEDPRKRQAAAAALGVRTAHEIDQPGYQSVQLHPRDCRAAFIEQTQIGFVAGPADALGTVILEVADAHATLQRAIHCGHRVEGESFHLGGVWHAVQDLQHGHHARFGCTVSGRRATRWLARLLGVCTDPLLTTALGARSNRSGAARRLGRSS